jgi:NAD-dependent dihydropyrimidine dehydrogenase PreA subunit
MKTQIDEDRCTGCGSCVEACSAGAMSLTHGLATVDHTICTQCQACIDACPTGAITTLADTPMIFQQPAVISDISEARPLLTKSQPWLASVLAFAEREILPRLTDILIGALERRFTRSTMTVVSPVSTPSGRLTAWGGGERRRVRYRGGRVGHGHYG